MRVPVAALGRVLGLPHGASRERVSAALAASTEQADAEIDAFMDRYNPQAAAKIVARVRHPLPPALFDGGELPSQPGTTVRLPAKPTAVMRTVLTQPPVIPPRSWRAAREPRATVAASAPPAAAQVAAETVAADDAEARRRRRCGLPVAAERPRADLTLRDGGSGQSARHDFSRA